jgi:hypothetical protein
MVLAVRIGATRLIDNLLIEIEQAGSLPARAHCEL